MFAKEFIAAALVFTASASKCPNVEVVQNLDAEAFMGTWYQAVATKDLPYAANDTVCTQAQYSDLQSNGTFKVTNSDQPSLSGERTYFVAPGHCPNGDGGCYVGPAIGSPNYEIIATDYDNYVAIFSCTRFSKEILYVLTRAPVDQAQLDEYL